MGFLTSARIGVQNFWRRMGEVDIPNTADDALILKDSTKLSPIDKKLILETLEDVAKLETTKNQELHHSKTAFKSHLEASKSDVKDLGDTNSVMLDRKRHSRKTIDLEQEERERNDDLII